MGNPWGNRFTCDAIMKASVMDLTTQILLIIPKRCYQRWSKSVRPFVIFTIIPAGTVFNASNNHEPMIIYARLPYHIVAPCHDTKTVSDLQDDAHAKAAMRNMLERIPEDRVKAHLRSLRRIIERVTRMPEGASLSMLRNQL